MKKLTKPEFLKRVKALADAAGLDLNYNDCDPRMIPDVDAERRWYRFVCLDILRDQIYIVECYDDEIGMHRRNNDTMSIAICYGNTSDLILSFLWNIYDAWGHLYDPEPVATPPIQKGVVTVKVTYEVTLGVRGGESRTDVITKAVNSLKEAEALRYYASAQVLNEQGKEVG